MPINGVVESKLRFLEQTLADLESWPLGNLAEFTRSSMLRRAVERALQLGVGSMIDVAERILAARCLPPADTAAQNFKRLQEIGILKDAERYAEMVRFRNLIVHRYEQIDPQIVLDLAKSKLGRFREFIDEVRNACAAGPSEGSDSGTVRRSDSCTVRRWRAGMFLPSRVHGLV